MRVHLIGVSGTGMGALAMLFREDGHDVTGSDVSFDPPIGPALREAGIACLQGYDPAHLGETKGGEASSAPDLVVVGNAIRRDNPEATAAKERGLATLSMSGALREYFLSGRRPLVVAGTHGKTTTSSMCAWVLTRAELEPGYFIGGLPKGLPRGAAIGSRRRRLASGKLGVEPAGAAPQTRAPFVIEGDEYDAVYWHKKPKFLDYVGVGADDVVIVTSVEHDHIDIYPDDASYEAAFVELVSRVPEDGLIVCDASLGASSRGKTISDAARIVRDHARARTAFYALEGDETGEVTPTWLGAKVAVDDAGMQPFDLFVGGMSCGRFALKVPGAHNIRNAIATVAACAEGFGVPVTKARSALAQFEGVKRRQDLLGAPAGVRVYDDFAHHPTAVDETLAALRAKHTGGRLVAVFEPRSATACRSLHQEAYVGAFHAADRVILAPLGRTNIPETERLDLARLAREIGPRAILATSVDDVLARILAEAHEGDTVAVLSNGAFGGIHRRLLDALAARGGSTA